MPSIREQARDIPIVEQCDICVVGGSCTGVFAAIAAAHLGAKVAIIEDKSGRWREPTAANPTFYRIPYRCIVPRGAKNLLAPGRALDADRGAYGAARVMVNCNQMGQAAGVASYLALNASADIAAVDRNTLRKTLTQQGAIVI